MGKIDKLSTKVISRHDIPSRKGNEVERSFRRALSPLDENVAKNYDNNEDDVVNHERKSQHTKILYTRHVHWL